MACSSGTTTSSLKTSSSEEDLQLIMDERKRKRKLSNRESARRSRIKKQNQLEEMMAQISQLRKENEQIFNRMNLTTDLYVNIESENSVLRAQMNELENRLNSLNEIGSFLNNGGGGFHHPIHHHHQQQQQIQICDDIDVSFFMNNNPWNPNSFPMMAAGPSSADMFMY
ncbi:hypothetical protein ACFE04_001879 [Oxalis oulophora]